MKILEISKLDLIDMYAQMSFPCYDLRMDELDKDLEIVRSLKAAREKYLQKNPSVFVFGEKTDRLLYYLLNSEHKLLVADYIDKEFKDKLDIKWHNKTEKVYELCCIFSFEFCESTDKIDAYLRDAGYSYSV